MAAKKLAWKFPNKDFVFMRIEGLFLLFVVVAVFLLSYHKGWFSAVVASLIFIGIYILVSYIVQKVRQVKEHYHISDTHLHIKKVIRGKESKNKVPLKDIKLHKLDKNFLGGYLFTHKNIKHLLFFNNKDELDKFDKHLNKHYKSRSKKTAKKKAAKKTTKRPTKTVKRKKK